ncbi:TPA: ead/Ea22-like family protein [Klebsiella oxytoca]|nr:ead/Ea22-like family protein [Klebsiella oxytoca]HEM7496424.1 ead/Ea22-like family protein [Klebsiella oxytoca]HEM7561279.1 ead/Ea22-like family protein [Klebsiella oxytoca]
MQSLESAGELSIKETKVMALAKAYQQLVAENAALKAAIDATIGWQQSTDVENVESVRMLLDINTPATDRIYAGIKADGRVEGAHFVANRMLAAWDAGFIEDTAKNAADIARMILTSIEFMAGAPEGDFDRSFADGILEDIAQQLREGDK